MEGTTVDARALPGQVEPHAHYAATGVVQKKYMPKYGQESFYVRLEDGQTLWVDQAHHKGFEVLDTIGVQGDMRHDGSVRVGPGDSIVVLARGVPVVEERTIELGYVSDPKQVGEEHWYLAKTDAGWYKIRYGVAKRYWLGDAEAERVEGRQNYYDLLGVSRDVAVEQVQAAWKRAICANHPDLFPVGQRDYQGDLSARINAARDCLTDKDERQRYDRQLAVEAGQRVEGEVIRAWPGRGFGTLRAKVEVRGESLLVIDILSWANEELHFEGSIDLRRVRVRLDGLQLEVGQAGASMFQQVERCTVPWDLVNMDRALLERVSSLVGWIGWSGGVLEYDIDAIRSGYWDWRESKVIETIRVREARLEWPEGFEGWLRQLARRHLADAVSYVMGGRRR